MLRQRRAPFSGRSCRRSIRNWCSKRRWRRRNIVDHSYAMCRCPSSRAEALPLREVPQHDGMGLAALWLSSGRCKRISCDKTSTSSAFSSVHCPQRIATPVAGPLMRRYSPKRNESWTHFVARAFVRDYSPWGTVPHGDNELSSESGLLAGAWGHRSGDCLCGAVMRNGRQ